MQPGKSRECAVCKSPGKIAPQLISPRIRNEIIVNMKSLNMQDIPSKDLDKLKRCLGFDLSYNQLNFSDGLCQHLTFVKYLNVSHNRLTRLPQNFGDLANLIVFDASDNQIAKLPISVYKCRKLQWMDLTRNPFLEKWCSSRGEKLSGFDPERFAGEIRPFMLAVKEWKQTFITQQAEEILEFLTICPSHMPSKDDAYYDLRVPDYKDCPFFNMMEKSPKEVESFLESLPKACKVNLLEKTACGLWNTFAERKKVQHATHTSTSN